ncbi:hypothetical protein RUND412_008806 [Rhizina undulata]
MTCLKLFFRSPSGLLCRRFLTTTPSLWNLKLTPSDQHRDLESFLQYAKNSNMDTESTVYVGTLYEYTVLSALSKINMNLSRFGGPGDGGIDIRGTWELPEPVEGTEEPRILNFLIQCKIKQMRTGPVFVRELEGAIASSDDRKTVGMLASSTPCTSGSIKKMLLSRRPLAFCCIRPYAEGGSLRQFIWNGPADVLLKGLGVTTSYIDSEGYEKEETFLTFNGKKLDEGLSVNKKKKTSRTK